MPPGANATAPSSDYRPPQGTKTEHSLTLASGSSLRYTATAEWMVLRERQKPVAEMFYVLYELGQPRDPARPITFVFNGGPGAASAYLHIGGLGPKRLQFNADGTLPRPPARLVDNLETWLAFTDLAFIDPIGTGFSRGIDDKDKAGESKEASAKGAPAAEKEFYQLNRDLGSLCEFIQSFLSKHKRWSSPVFIAGESYGGFRVAKLARKLQEDHGVGLNGAILISPALEWYYLNASDYDIMLWSNAFPSMVLTSMFHGKSRAYSKDTPLDRVLREVEAFASSDFVVYLAQGEAMESTARDRTIGKIADMLGLDKGVVVRSHGRIWPHVFTRLVLREEGRVCGLYDSTITAVDPFPDRDTFQGPDPTLFAISRMFTAGINAQIREVLGVDSERAYHLLSMEVNQAWKVDDQKHALDTYVGATDDLRYAMSLNPHMKVYITHGHYDLVTPYYASNRVQGLMKLDSSLRPNLHIEHFPGGHMFYTWDSSRRAFTSSMLAFYQNALNG